MCESRACVARRAERRARYSSAGAWRIPRLSRERAGVFAPADELLVPQVIGRRMIRQVAARHARQLLAAQLAHGPAKRRRCDDAMELPMILRDARTDRVQLGGRG